MRIAFYQCAQCTHRRRYRETSSKRVGSCATTAWEIGPGAGIEKKHLLSVPVPSFTNFVHSKCTGTRFYQFRLDQSDIALKVGRAHDWEDLFTNIDIDLSELQVLVLLDAEHRSCNILVGWRRRCGLERTASSCRLQATFVLDEDETTRQGSGEVHKHEKVPHSGEHIELELLERRRHCRVVVVQPVHCSDAYGWNTNPLLTRPHPLLGCVLRF